MTATQPGAEQFTIQVDAQLSVRRGPEAVAAAVRCTLADPSPSIPL